MKTWRKSTTEQKDVVNLYFKSKYTWLLYK